MKEVFDRDKLEELIQRHTVEPTNEFVMEELERCKDPRYFYNNYWSVDGKAVKQLSAEEWNAMNNHVRSTRIFIPRGAQTISVTRPLMKEECFKHLPDYLKPDGN